MANRCQICIGEPRVAVEDWRSVWLGMPDGFYLEWGRCCNEKEFDTPVVLTNGNTGVSVTLKTPQELWVLIAGEDNKDVFGTAVWY